MKLDSVDRKYLILNAIRMTSNYRKQQIPLWAIVRDLCSVGSTSAAEICQEIGMDPHSPASKPEKLVEP